MNGQDRQRLRWWRRDANLDHASHHPAPPGLGLTVETLAESGPIGAMLIMTIGAFSWLGKRFIDDLTKRDEECREERREWLEAFQEGRDAIRQLTEGNMSGERGEHG